MKITQKILFLSFLLMMNISYTQNNKSVTIKTELKTIEYNNGREIFNIYKINPNISFNEKLDYYWYNEFSKIKSTKGSSGGNLLHGKYQFFDEKGNLINESNYKSGLKDGSEKEWEANGEIKSIHKYIKGEQIYSKFKSTNSDNWIEWVGPVLINGSVKNIYSSYGLLEQSELYLEKLKYKVTKYYNDNKLKKIYTTDILNRMYDEYISYHENGKIKVYGQYIENLKNGEWKWFNEDGTLKSIEKNRISKIYSVDNILIAIGGEFFDANKDIWIKNGNWIWYDDDGKNIKDMKDYEYGEEIVKEKKE